VYVIKGLNCKILLGNDFNIKYNLKIDFKNKNIQIENNITKMDEIWYKHNENHNTNLYMTGRSTSNTLNNKHEVNIKSNDNITIAPKSKVKLKIYTTSENIQNQYAIMLTERLH